LTIMCTRQCWPRVLSHTASTACQKVERAVGDRELRTHGKVAPLEVEQELTPGLRALAPAANNGIEHPKLLERTGLDRFAGAVSVEPLGPPERWCTYCIRKAS